MSGDFQIHVGNTIDNAGELQSVHRTLMNAYDALQASIRTFCDTNAGSSMQQYADGAWKQDAVQAEMNVNLQNGARTLEEMALEHQRGDQAAAQGFSGVGR